MTITDQAQQLADAYRRTVWVVTPRSGPRYVAVRPSAICGLCLSLVPVSPKHP